MLSTKHIGRNIRPALWLAVICTSSLAAFGATTNAPVGESYSDFKLIAKRNIFNPNRTSRQKVEVPRTPKVEAFALVATMSYEKGDFAFFDGSNPAFKKAVQVGGQIGDCTVTAIAYDHVSITNAALQLDLPIHMQLRRVDEGQWQLQPLTRAFTPDYHPTYYASTARSFDSLDADVDSDADTLDFAAGRKEKDRDISDKTIRKLTDGDMSDKQVRKLERSMDASEVSAVKELKAALKDASEDEKRALKKKFSRRGK